MESMLGETRSVGCMVEFGHLYFISLYRGGCILQLGEGPPRPSNYSLGLDCGMLEQKKPNS